MNANRREFFGQCFSYQVFTSHVRHFDAATIELLSFLFAFIRVYLRFE